MKNHHFQKSIRKILRFFFRKKFEFFSQLFSIIFFSKHISSSRRTREKIFRSVLSSLIRIRTRQRSEHVKKHVFFLGLTFMGSFFVHFGQLLEAISPSSDGVWQNSWYLGVVESLQVYARKISEQSEKLKIKFCQMLRFFCKFFLCWLPEASRFINPLYNSTRVSTPEKHRGEAPLPPQKNPKHHAKVLLRIIR